MRKLQLQYSDIIQGDFEIKTLNVLLVFQVNCPGCFSYALPFFNNLYKEFTSKGVSFIALSTAFEDFDKNTFENTKALVENGDVVGETQKMFLEQDYDSLPYTLDFPIVMDKIEEELSELDVAIGKICSINPNYDLLPNLQKEQLQNQVEKYLKSLEKIALTFTLNQLRGTPSFVIFNKDYEILSEWFGHAPYEQISSKIASLI